MASFTDQAGRDWVVRITNRTIRDVKDRNGVDLRELLNDECRPLLELISDSLRLSDILYTACREQALELGVTVDDFLDGFYGDVSETAGEAFCRAFVDFFPNPQLRKAIDDMLGLTRILRNEIATEANLRVQAAIASTDIESIVKRIVSPESSA
ncbi:MAG: hypothetical protein SGI77_02310 [Pirellulaceae bacterium]|nr:hypothetical protein [Pirellulaceae bacterium]